MAKKKTPLSKKKPLIKYASQEGYVEAGIGIKPSINYQGFDIHISMGFMIKPGEEPDETLKRVITELERGLAEHSDKLFGKMDTYVQRYKKGR